MFNARNWTSKQLLVQFDSSPAIEENAKIVAKWPGKTLISLERCRGFQPGGVLSQLENSQKGFCPPCKKEQRGLYPFVYFILFLSHQCLQ